MATYLLGQHTEVRMGLKLLRRTGQTILIGDDIELTFYKLKNGKALVEIEAPDGVSIRRGEVAYKCRKRPETIDTD